MKTKKPCKPKAPVPVPAAEESQPMPSISVGHERIKYVEVPAEVVEVSLWNRIIRYFVSPKDKNGQPLKDAPRPSPLDWDNEREESELFVSDYKPEAAHPWLGSNSRKENTDGWTRV